jgi:hypothetical protein
MNIRNNKGFIALVSLLIIALGSITFSLTILRISSLYLDGIYKKEERLQRSLISKIFI